jgi:hypothetical protein
MMSQRVELVETASFTMRTDRAQMVKRLIVRSGKNLSAVLFIATLGKLMTRPEQHCQEISSPLKQKHLLGQNSLAVKELTQWMRMGKQSTCPAQLMAAMKS